MPYSSSVSSASFTVGQEFVGPSNPNVLIYACTDPQCPNASNNYSIAGLPGVQSTGGHDLLAMTPVSTMNDWTTNTSGDAWTLNLTWTAPADLDQSSQCFVIPNGVTNSDITETSTFLWPCKGQTGSITVSTAGLPPKTTTVSKNFSTDSKSLTL